MRVRFTQPAQRDLAKIIDDLAGVSPQVAAKFSREIAKFAELISDNPDIGRSVPSGRARVCPLIRMGYLVFSRRRGQEVQILRIRHARRRPLNP